jgi:hypothetical protein
MSGASGAGVDAGADRDGSSGKGGGVAGDAARDGDARGGASGTGGAGAMDGGTDGAPGTDGASGRGGSSGIDVADTDAADADGTGGTGGAGGIDATTDADGADGPDGSDSAAVCAQYPLSAKATWIATASHSSLGNSQESDPLYNPPSHAHDGVIAERWSTGKPQSGNEWLQIDFGQSVAITQVTLQLGTNSSDYPRGYAARVSEMPLDFAAPVLVTGVGQPSVDSVMVLAPPAVGRYLLIAQTGSASSWWSVAEASVACSD